MAAGLGDAEGEKCRAALVYRNSAQESGLTQHGECQRS